MKNTHSGCSEVRSAAATSPAATRRGSILVMTAVCLGVLATLAAFAINVAYMEVVRTELQLTCDSAAKAALIRYQQSQSQSDARTFARTISANNPVASQTLTFTDNQIEFGNATLLSGSYQFVPNQNPLNAVRVSASPAISLWGGLGGNLSTNSFSPTRTSVAYRINHDICLVLDRSASMAFDLSNGEFSYPADRSTGSLFQNYFSTPSPTGSRWKYLSDAVGVFANTLQSRQVDAQIAVVTYSEAYTFGNYSCTTVSTDVGLTKNYSQVTASVNQWFNKALLGNTNIEAGMNQATSVLTGAGSRTSANRTVILVTDGVATTGSTDIASIAQAMRGNQQIVTHVISFGGQANNPAVQSMLQNTASNGYGTYYPAPTSATLTAAFQQIAEKIPAVYID